MPPELFAAVSNAAGDIASTIGMASTMATSMRNVLHLALCMSPLLLLIPKKFNNMGIRRDHLIAVSDPILLVLCISLKHIYSMLSRWVKISQHNCRRLSVQLGSSPSTLQQDWTNQKSWGDSLNALVPFLRQQSRQERNIGLLEVRLLATSYYTF